MTDKRRLTLAVTVYVTADVEVDSNKGGAMLELVHVDHSIMGGMLPLDPAAVMLPQEDRDKVAKHGAVLALQYVLDKYAGKHDEKPPEITQHTRGTDA